MVFNGKRDAETAEVALFLIWEGAEVHRKEWIAGGTFLDAALRLGVEGATSGFRLLRELKFDFNLIHGHRDMNTLLDAAAQKGYSDLVNLARSEGALFTENSLIYAIQSENMDLARYVIQEGGSLQVESNEIPKKSKGKGLGGGPVQSPLSAAIRSQNTDIVQYLEARGALSNLRSESHFNAAVCASAEVGNLDVLRILIKRNLGKCKMTFGAGVRSALEGGQEEAALMLVEAGAWPMEVRLLGTALSKNMKRLFYRLLDSNVRPSTGRRDVSLTVTGYRPEEPLLVAIELGNIEVMKDLIFAGALQTIPGRHETTCQNPLCLAATKKDPRIVRKPECQE